MAFMYLLARLQQQYQSLPSSEQTIALVFVYHYCKFLWVDYMLVVFVPSSVNRIKFFGEIYNVASKLFACTT